MKAEAGEISTLSAFIFGERNVFSINWVKSMEMRDKRADKGEERYEIKTMGTPPKNGPIVGMKQKMP